MGEMIGNDDDDNPTAHHIDDKFYFVNEDHLKESLCGSDGPSFSVASLFSSNPPPPRDAAPDPPEPKTGPTTLFAKQTFFITDPKDPRIADVGRFFDVPVQMDPQEMKVRRREIHLIVKSKFKRAERNRENVKNPSSNKFSKPRHKFMKKRKT